MKRIQRTQYLAGLSILTLMILVFASCGKDSDKGTSPDTTETGTVSGHCYYASTEIPIPDVLMSIGSLSATTESDGSYSLNHVPTGEAVLSASREGYDAFADTVTVLQAGIVVDIEMTSSQYTHILHGTISAFGTLEPVPDVTVTVLNNDGSPTQLETVSDSEGLYQIHGVPQGYRWIQYRKETYYTSTQRINITNSDDAHDIQLTGFVMGTVTDIDGNTYLTVQIGDQWWMAENLKVTRYRNGDSIPDMTDGSEWAALTTGGRCDYNNNAGHVSAYGRLYNWYAVDDSGGIAPEGWHVPSDEDWQTLIGYLGGSAWAGGRMREAGTDHWNSPNTGADNSSGFTALPGGYRNPSDGSFLDMGILTYFWSATELDDELASRQRLYHKDRDIYHGYSDKQYGFSVRCVKD